MDKKVFLVLMKHCFFDEKQKTLEDVLWLDKNYSNSALNLNEAKWAYWRQYYFDSLAFTHTF